jgi:two-component system LytT family response regulator
LELLNVERAKKPHFKVDSHNSLVTTFPERFVLGDKQDWSFHSQDSVIYIKANGSYTEWYFENGRKKTVSRGLGQFVGKLSDKFFRLHHSYVVNLDKIESYSIKRSAVTLIGGEQLPVSKRKKREFENIIVAVML